MKIRAIGTGSPDCRHPLVTSCLLVQLVRGNILVGCGFNVPAKLESVGISPDQVDMIVLADSRHDQIAGLIEMADRSKRAKIPIYLSAPEVVLINVRLWFEQMTGLRLQSCFEVRSSQRVTLADESNQDSIAFIANYHQEDTHALMFEQAGVFVSGHMKPNEEFLHRYGMQASLILHGCTTTPSCYDQPATIQEIQELPVYLQQRMWLYGYGNNHLVLPDPFPAMFLRQGTCLYDSERKEQHLDKERFIRENARQQINQS